MKTIILLLSLALTACQYVPPRDINSPFFSPPVGSQLRLTRPLTIPADDAGVFIQHGEPQYSSRQLNKYYPHCDFELRTRTSHERVVQADTFTVTRTVRETEHVSLTPVTPSAASVGGGIGVGTGAGISIGIGYGFGLGDSSSIENYMTVLYLRSSRQPDVFRMTCQHWEDSSQGDHLTVKQIRQVLGELFILDLAGDRI